KLLGWFLGSTLAGLLLLPTFGYYLAMRRFGAAHRDYLNSITIPNPFFLLFHNANWILGMLVVGVAGVVARRLRPRDANETPPPPQPAFVWLAFGWILLPQVAAFLLAYRLNQPVLLSRYLSYTSLALALLMGYHATRGASRPERRLVVLLTTLFLFSWGFS